jgi:nucleotide-binding universal stress UspA family protein
MTLLVAYPPDGRSRAVLHLAALLARSAGDDLLLSAVVPTTWPPGPARVDAEYRAELARAAEDALDRARSRLPEDIAADVVIQHARSAAAGLLEVAEQRGASLIVAGSSTAGGPGSVTLGSATSRLLHSSPLPVALAPRGYRAAADARVLRVTAAFGADDDELVVAAAGVAARVGATLRLASFAVHPRAPYTIALGREAERSALQEWATEIAAAQQAALARVRDLPDVPEECEAVVGHGESWEEALDDVDWHAGDVLVVGSSSVGPLKRVFLGSRSSKIVQESPVPAVVVPRGVAAELAAGQRAADGAPPVTRPPAAH